MATIANKQQLWQSRIEECQNSPIPAKQWCQENHVAYSTYSYWVRKNQIGSRVWTEDSYGGTSLCTASIATGYSECPARNGSPSIYLLWDSPH